MQQITVVGGGLAGLTAAITAAEAGAPVHLLEAHDALGGRARSTEAPYKANLGPHAMYKDGPLWAWLRERGLLPPVASPPLAGIRVRWEGAIRRTPPRMASSAPTRCARGGDGARVALAPSHATPIGALMTGTTTCILIC
jgi:phytoene dehydrogenase-like protein